LRSSYADVDGIYATRHARTRSVSLLEYSEGRLDGNRSTDAFQRPSPFSVRSSTTPCPLVLLSCRRVPRCWFLALVAAVIVPFRRVLGCSSSRCVVECEAVVVLNAMQPKPRQITAIPPQSQRWVGSTRGWGAELLWALPRPSWNSPERGDRSQQPCTHPWNDLDIVYRPRRRRFCLPPTIGPRRQSISDDFCPIAHRFSFCIQATTT
jgi:hypothetical protein